MSKIYIQRPPRVSAVQFKGIESLQEIIEFLPEDSEVKILKYGIGINIGGNRHTKAKEGDFITKDKDMNFSVIPEFLFLNDYFPEDQS